MTKCSCCHLQQINITQGYKANWPYTGLTDASYQQAPSKTLSQKDNDRSCCNLLIIQLCCIPLTSVTRPFKHHKDPWIVLRLFHVWEFGLCWFSNRRDRQLKWKKRKSIYFKKTNCKMAEFISFFNFVYES